MEPRLAENAEMRLLTRDPNKCLVWWVGDVWRWRGRTNKDLFVKLLENFPQSGQVGSPLCLSARLQKAPNPLFQKDQTHQPKQLNSCLD